MELYAHAHTLIAQNPEARDFVGRGVEAYIISGGTGDFDRTILEHGGEERTCRVQFSAAASARRRDF